MPKPPEKCAVAELALQLIRGYPNQVIYFRPAGQGTLAVARMRCLFRPNGRPLTNDDSF